MVIHQATTPTTSAHAATRMRGRRESQNAQIAKAAKAIAPASRSSGHGRFEK